ncbi:DUF998 domain-containing protein [Candidatus Dojkabacteria bacterium]|nr:DUF998 domain-containing protein [Candidatus Dojkabacteria bacterium]
MTDLTKIFLAIFIIYQPITLFILIQLERRFQGYTIRRDVVSLLGTQEFPYGFIFNLNAVVYGLSALSLALAQYQLLERTLLNQIGFISLLVCCLATASAGIFPMHTRKIPHIISSYFVFGGIFMVAVSHIPIFYQQIFSYSSLILYSGIVAITIVILLSSYLNKKLQHSLPEWMAIFFAILWNTSVSILMITN